MEMIAWGSHFCFFKHYGELVKVNKYLPFIPTSPSHILIAVINSFTKIISQ
jgi:hypothetical protein